MGRELLTVCQLSPLSGEKNRLPVVVPKATASPEVASAWRYTISKQLCCGNPLSKFFQFLPPSSVRQIQSAPFMAVRVVSLLAGQTHACSGLSSATARPKPNFAGPSSSLISFQFIPPSVDRKIPQ